MNTHRYTYSLAFALTTFIFMLCSTSAFAQDVVPAPEKISTRFKEVQDRLEQTASFQANSINRIVALNQAYAEKMADCQELDGRDGSRDVCLGEGRVMVAQGLALRHESLTALMTLKQDLMRSIDALMSVLEDEDNFVAPLQRKIDGVIKQLDNASSEAVKLAVLLEYGMPSGKMETSLVARMRAQDATIKQHSMLKEKYLFAKDQLSHLDRSPMLTQLDAVRASVAQGVATYAAEKEYIETIAEVSIIVGDYNRDANWITRMIGDYVDLHNKITESAPFVSDIITAAEELLAGPTLIEVPEFKAPRAVSPIFGDDSETSEESSDSMRKRLLGLATQEGN